MMPQQQRQQQGQQQRPNQPSGPTGQIQQMIYHHLNQNTGPLSGWQAGVLIQERISLIFNIIGNLRLASQNQPNPPPLQKMIEIGLKFEKDIFDKSVDKDEYKRQLQQKLDQLLERRAQNQANLQQSLQMQAQAQAQAQQAAQAQQMMMNQNSMQGQVPRTMPQQPAQQGFHHLQHQMQASPIPGQQTQQMAMGISNDGMAQNMTQNQQQQFQLSMQQQQQIQHQAQQQQQQQQSQNGPGRPQNAQPPLTAADNAIVGELTNRLMAASSPEEKTQIRVGMQNRMDPQTLQRYQQQNLDPVMMYFRQQAMQKFRADKAARMVQAQAQAQLSVSQQQSQNVPTTAPPMQQQRSMNPSPLNGQTQPPTSIGGNPEFGFMGNMGNLIDQQQQGVMAQEAGQMVVPVSGAQRNATPQPGSIPGHPLNMNDQRAVPNPNVRAQQQQHMFNAQQAQQQRMQHAAQQHSQAAARASAQAKAQQMALQGQPGGMGSGPMPPQQSPAMATLNTPLRTPSQQMNPEPPQINPNGQFGQPLDPRFLQGNQRTTAPGGFNPAMLAAMPQEQQQRLAGLPQDKLIEVVNRWHEQRAQHMNAANAQAGRPPMQIQGNNQFRPGQQVPPSGQFNPQAGLNQFMGGQRPQQSIATGMTAQQQMILQQQMARFNQQNPNQPRPSPQNMTPIEQRTIMQMDSMDFPPALLNHAHMPRGIPVEIKKWGPLKQWAQSTPTLAPEAFEHIKGLQKLHYQQILRAKNQQTGQPQPMGIAAGGQAGPGSAPMVPPGMSAPVAPMGQNPMQVPNGMNIGPGQIRQPTPQDIQAARNHPSGKMANLADDQIRTILIRNQMNNQQQQQQRQNQMMQQMQLANQISQVNSQQPRSGMQGQVGNLMGASQNPAGQITQTKQPQPTSDPVMPTPNTAGRPNRVPNGRDAGQNSSPAPPSRKRANSDDVIEVPNPNTQPQRAPTQQNQGPKAVAQQARPNLTQQQIAQLDPEARKKYEQALRMFQASREQPNPHMAKLKSIMEEEVAKARDPLPDVHMDQETRSRVAGLLRDMHAPLNNMGKAIPKWYTMTRDDNRAREFFRTRHRLAKQYKDREMKEPKSTFSMSLPQAEEALQLLRGMVQDLSDRFPTLKRQDAAQAQPDSAAPQAVAPNAQTAVPLNVANLQQHQQQLKQHQRTASRNAQTTPAAPTSSQPPFPFGGGSSPHGTPAYIGKSTVTQENLHLPARKKARPNNSTPVQGQGNSVSSAPSVKSPEVKRQQAPDSKPQQKPSLCCREPDCERHNVGFDSQEALDLHTQEEHVGPLQNPLKFALENLASATNLDTQGRPNKPVNSVLPESTPTASVKMAANGSRQGQTPLTPAGTSTPMNRQASLAGAKPNADSKDILAKADQKGPNKQDRPTQAEPAADPWANTTIDPTELSQAFQGFDAGATGAISDRNTYRSITPNDTPESSKDGLSEPNSDISEGVNLDINLDLFDENWQPFGAGDIDGLADINDFNFGDEDVTVTMLDAEEPPIDFQAWDDMIDFDKPFAFDVSMYSMGE